MRSRAMGLILKACPMREPFATVHAYALLRSRETAQEPDQDQMTGKPALREHPQRWLSRSPVGGSVGSWAQDMFLPAIPQTAPLYPLLVCAEMPMLRPAYRNFNAPQLKQTCDSSWRG